MKVMNLILFKLTFPQLTLIYLNLAYRTLLSLPYRRARAPARRAARRRAARGARARRYGKLSKVR